MSSAPTATQLRGDAHETPTRVDDAFPGHVIAAAFQVLPTSTSENPKLVVAVEDRGVLIPVAAQLVTVTQETSVMIGVPGPLGAGGVVAVTVLPFQVASSGAKVNDF